MDRLRLKRAYAEPDPADGRRVLVDRLWPRGLTKADAALDAWAKDAAPSTELRKWFHAGEGDWPAFRRRYLRELADRPDATDELVEHLASGRTLTLVYAAKDEAQNHAVVLADYLRTRLATQD